MTDLKLLYDEKEINEIIEDSDCKNGICSKYNYSFI